MTDRRPIIMLSLHTGHKADPLGRAPQWAADDGPQWLRHTADAIEAEYGDGVIVGFNQPAGKLPGHKVHSEQWRAIDSERKRAIVAVCHDRLLRDRSTAVYIGGRIHPNWRSERSMETVPDMLLHAPSRTAPYGGLIVAGCTHLIFDLVSNRSGLMDPGDRSADDVRWAFVEFASHMKEAWGTQCIGEAIPNTGDGRLLEKWASSVPWMAMLDHLDLRDPDRLWDAHGKTLYVGVRPNEKHRVTGKLYEADDLRERLDRGFIPIIYTTRLEGFPRWRGVLDDYLHKEAA